MKQGAMTPAELERIRGELGVSQAYLASLFNVDARTMRRYVAGDCEIPRALAYALRMMQKFKVTPGDLDKAFK